MIYSVAIIGAGNIASMFDTPDSNKILTHAHAVFQHEHYRLLGFYDTDKDRAIEAAQKWDSEAFDSMEELVSRADVCVCCTPDKYHTSVIEKISDLDCQIIITEKPIADSVKNAKALFDRVYERIPIAVNYSRRYIPEYQQLKDEITRYGRLVKGVAYYGKGLIHNGSHFVDLFRFILGESTDSKRLQLETNDYGDDITYDAVLSWGSSSIYLVGVDSRNVTIFEADLMFENGRIRLVDSGQVIEVYSKNESDDYKGYYGYSLVKTIRVDYSDALVGLYNNVYNHLQGKEVLVCDLKDGLRDIEICEKIRLNE